MSSVTILNKFESGWGPKQIKNWYLLEGNPLPYTCPPNNARTMHILAGEVGRACERGGGGGLEKAVLEF